MQALNYLQMLSNCRRLGCDARLGLNRKARKKNTNEGINGDTFGEEMNEHMLEKNIMGWFLFIIWLGGGFKCFLLSPLFGEDEPNLTSIFFKGVETTN